MREIAICGRYHEYVGIRSIKNDDIEQGFRSRVAGASHGCPDLSWESYVCCNRCSRRQAEVSRRGRALSSPTLKTRCRRCEARYGLRGVRVGEALHPGPARPVRRSARLRAQEVSPTAVDTPSPTHPTLLDSLEFDLTIADSTESESGGHKPRVPELLAIAQFSEALISDRGRVQFGVRLGRFAVLDEPGDDSPTVIDPVAVDPSRSEIPEESGPIHHRPTSRVVLMSQGVPVGRLNPSPPSEDVEDSDFDRGGNSDLEDGEDEVDDPVPEVVVPTPAELSRVAIDSGFRSLDSVTLETEFRTRSCLMRVVPKMMRGVFRTALRLSFQAVTQARAEGDVERETRAWKLFLLAPRMLLSRPPRGGKVSRAKLVERCAAFARGVDSFDQYVQSGCRVWYYSNISPTPERHRRRSHQESEEGTAVGSRQGKY